MFHQRKSKVKEFVFSIHGYMTTPLSVNEMNSKRQMKDSLYLNQHYQPMGQKDSSWAMAGDMLRADFGVVPARVKNLPH